MNRKELTEKWVAALRSGQYKQASHALQAKPDRFCCLGVLCQVAEENGLDVVRDERGYLFGNTLFLQDAVSDLMRFKDTSQLMAKNDGGIPFPEIADFIESHGNGIFFPDSPNTSVGSDDNA